MSRHKSDHYRRTIDPVQKAVVENPTQPTLSMHGESSVVEAGNISEPLIVQAIQNQPDIRYQEEESLIEGESRAPIDAEPILPVVGWGSDMLEAPTDGSRVMVSETAKDQGVLVYWRISKFVDRKNLRYVARGRWTDFLSKVDIAFIPKYWKPYDPEEYWPLQGGGT